MTEGNSEQLGSRQARSRVLPTQLVQYGVALLSVAFALGTTLSLSSYLEPTPTALFFAAVMVSAWYGGLGPGIFATILSTLAINYCLLEPIYSLNTPNLGTVVQLGVFVMAALLINSLNEAQRAARRRAEANLQSLRESEARFGCLAESNIIGTIVAELNGAILDANDNFLQLVGYTEEELRSGRMHWREMTSPESLEMSERAVQELLTTGACTPFEKEYLRKDGSRIPVLHGAVMTGEATVTGFVLDLNERKRSEAIQQEALRRERSLHAEVQAAKAQLETVLASLNDQFLVLDQDWRYIYVSDRVVKTVGKSREELIGKCIWEVFPDTVGSPFYTEVHRAVAEQQTVQFEYFYAPWQRWFENRVYPSNTGVSILVTDITQRKQAEAELQASEERFRLLLATTTAVVWTTNTEGEFICTQPSWENYTGQCWEEYAGLGWIEMFHPDDREALNARWNRALAERSYYEAEGRLWYAPSQQYRHIIARAVPLLNADGSVREWVGMDTDIHDQKLAEEALRQSEARFQVLVSNMPGMVYRSASGENGETAFTYVSSGSRELVELEPETILQDANSFLALIHPDDLSAFQESVAIAIENSAVWQWEGRLITPSGQPKWIQGRSRPQQTEYGEAWDGLLLDITDRKRAEESLRQSEERLRLALDAGCMGAWEWNLETNVQRWDVNQYKLFGMDKDSNQLSTDTFFQFIHPDDLPSAQQLTEQVLEQGGSFHTEFRIITLDGSIRWLSSQGIVVQDSHNRSIRMIGVNFDITERKQEEAEREKLLANEQFARQEAERANRIKDEFLAVLSHELRSPLNPILGWSRLLQTQKLDEQKTRQALSTIERNAKLQTQLIEDLLDVSRILRGKLVLNTTPVSLINTIEAALETVRLAIEAKGIQVQRAFNLNIDQVMGDAARLQQVVWNLLTNAVKFTPSGGTIEIQLEQSNTQAQIQVRDTGKGIKPEFLPYVFDYFRQEDGTTTRKFGGLGLGLAIVRHITELHGGRVWAESPGEGLGATFTVELPLISISMNIVNEQAESPTIADLSGLRVLAVDDDADIRELIAFILQQAGAEVRVVASATEVLQQLEAFSPEILISDVGMPDFDGYMLMRQIRRLPLKRGIIPAIALTAYAGEIDQQQAIASGFQMHLAKPVEPEKLIGAIVTLLNDNAG